MAVADPPQTVRYCLSLATVPASVPEARRAVRTELAARGLDADHPLTDTVLLVVSELVTNACKYAPGPVLMDLRIASGCLEITVWDSDPRLPVARAAEAGRIGQHGLEIVMAVAAGFEAQREVVGKRITARLPLTEPVPQKPYRRP